MYIGNNEGKQMNQSLTLSTELQTRIGLTQLENSRLLKQIDKTYVTIIKDEEYLNISLRSYRHEHWNYTHDKYDNLVCFIDFKTWMKEIISLQMLKKNHWVKSIPHSHTIASYSIRENQTFYNKNLKAFDVNVKGKW